MDNKCDLTILQDGLSELGISLDETQIDQFVQYYEILIEWNSFMNLTAQG